jgi:hypothetical protein
MVGNRSQMLELADILRQDLLYASGIAMLKVILTDGTGPAYTDQRGDVLARQLQVARAELSSRAVDHAATDRSQPSTSLLAAAGRHVRAIEPADGPAAG